MNIHFDCSYSFLKAKKNVSFSFPSMLKWKKRKKKYVNCSDQQATLSPRLMRVQLNFMLNVRFTGQHFAFILICLYKLNLCGLFVYALRSIHIIQSHTHNFMWCLFHFYSVKVTSQQSKPEGYCKMQHAHVLFHVFAINILIAHSNYPSLCSKRVL